MLIRHTRKLCNFASFFNKFPKSVRKMSSSEVIFEECGNKGIIILNRPKALNALNLNMIRMLYPKLKEWEDTKMLVIIKGEGEKAFCAGGDVLSITEAGKNGEPLTKEFFKEEYLLNCLIGLYRIPYIALIDGITMGGGVGVSVHGKYRVATEKSLFAMPETGIGLFPDVGGSFFLPRLSRNLGMYLGLTGHRLKGKDILHAGIATHFCDQSKIEDLQHTLLKSDKEESLESILNQFSNSSTVGKTEEFSLIPYLSEIQSCFAGDSVEQIINNLEKVGSDWAKKHVALLNRMSPTSLKITHEVLRRGIDCTLQQCFSMEYRLSQRCCGDHDFYEGVRAVLVDKDNSPKWKPDSLSGVTKDVIDKYFSSLSTEDELVI